nr:pentatricopeptide repeat protein AaPPR920 [Agave angustifolia]
MNRLLFKCHYHHSPPPPLSNIPKLPSNPSLYYATLLQSLTKTPSPSSSFSLVGLGLHSQILKLGLDSDRFVGNSLLSLYFKLSPDVTLTRRLFDHLPARDVISWTSLLAAYVRHGRPLHALHLFVEMSHSNIAPNGFTLSASISACKDLEDMRLGRCFHGMVLVRGLEPNYVIASSLIDMYGRNGALDEALQVFDEMGRPPDAVCWTTMVSACTRNDRFKEAVTLFYTMARGVGVLFDGFTFGSVLTALGNLGEERARQGKEAHAKVITSGLEGNVVVESSVVDMYAKCGLIGDSRKVFDRMRVKNVVSWCALLNGYCHSGENEAVLSLFREMDKESDQDHYSFGTVLRACAGLAAVRLGKEVHCRFLRTGGWRHVVVESALVDLYAKCGCIDYAHRMFSAISSRNMITWNAMVCGLAQNGRAKQAVEMFDEMIREGFRPDYISFIGVLFACSHTGMISEGKNYFRSMKEDYKIRPGIEHYNCMVDLFSRVGLLEEAEELIMQSEVFRDDSSLWAALLGACATYSNPSVAERVAKKMMELEPGYHLSYVLLANVYKMVGRWNDALEIRKVMRSRGVRKELGKSWIEAESGSISSDCLSAEWQKAEDLNFEGEASSTSH